MRYTTIGSRFQVVIPKEVRERLKLKPHTKVVVGARDGHLVLFPVRGGELRGMGKELADGADAVDYVKRLRQEWEQRSGNSRGGWWAGAASSSTRWCSSTTSWHSGRRVFFTLLGTGWGRLRGAFAPARCRGRGPRPRPGRLGSPGPGGNWPSLFPRPRAEFSLPPQRKGIPRV